MAAVYDRIGTGYAPHRRPEPRWASRIRAALGDARHVLDVGAGAGSYEPRDRQVVALDPSRTMLAQRPPGAAPAVRGRAEALPFPDRAFDAALAVLTIHHWSDPAAGLSELRRVAARQVVVTWDPAIFRERFWLVRDYVPEAAEREAPVATLASAIEHLEADRVEALPVPHDCADGFFGAYWRRPEAYLDPGVRGAISGLALLDAAIVADAMERLRDDLASGRWHERYRELETAAELDLGYRVVVATGR